MLVALPRPDACRLHTVSYRACVSTTVCTALRVNEDVGGPDTASGTSSAGALQGGGGAIPAHRGGSGGQRRHADAGVGGEHAPGGCSGECSWSSVGAGPCRSGRHQVQDKGGLRTKLLALVCLMLPLCRRQPFAWPKHRGPVVSAHAPAQSGLVWRRPVSALVSMQ